MTKQVSEVLLHNDIEYPIVNVFPLENYLSTLSDVSLNMYTSAHWRGYEGHWTIQNDSLFLIKLEGNKEEFNKYFDFDSNDKYLAHWFNGLLKIGIGKMTRHKFVNTYEHHIVFLIKGGQIIEKKVDLNDQEFNPKLHFGKYKGHNINDFIVGKIFTKTSECISEFIKSFITLLINPKKEYVISSEHNLSIKELEYLNSDIKHIKFKVENNVINFDTEYPKLFYIITKILNSDLSKFFINEKGSNYLLGLNFISVVNSDISYINWLIEKVDTFSINPTYLTKSHKSYSLKRISLKKKSNIAFELIPEYTFQVTNFSEYLVEVNNNKYCKMYNVEYNKQFKELWSTLPLSQMPTAVKDYFNYKEIPSSENAESKYYNSDDWLRDASGTNDSESMEQVFWNLD